MTKEVLVSIAGLQYENESDEAIELISTGEYYFRNNKHYVMYDELLEDKEGDSTATVKCTLKISEKQIEVIRKEPAAVHMIFELGQNHMTYYSTPYGDLMMGITTNSIKIEENEDVIDVELTYALDMNYQFVSDCKLTIKIKSK
ncbi:MAG: DUF1934 domain-containing protein [Clostridiales bacterium]|nr:DUF1934 domain-containing protein [Clostridiales bacterium]